MLPVSARDTIRYVPSDYDLEDARRVAAAAQEALAKAEAPADATKRPKGKRATADDALAAARRRETAARERLDQVEANVAACGGAEKVPVYLLGVPTVMGRSAFRRDVRAAGGRFVDQAEMAALAREAVAAVVHEDDQAKSLELLDRVSAIGPGDTLEHDDAIMLRNLEAVLQREYRAYAEAVADRDYWWQLALWTLPQHFLSGWENVEAAFATRNGRVEERALEALVAERGEAELNEVALKIMSLMQVPEGLAKN